ncbi:3D-(3,5/4)-trihydroxycyclohexane-1,2-dione acylhydrolase (decyclizing) [Enterovibrio norvegicus]|uniref:3D-(3,5/4)-trihydroxycyclohexane-1,2-dione acylhydrolase (Decyclizing) n=1 Tax=Enterovibrio norvegicus TaxID=188144 RepID=A0ABV4KZH8_9GAMM|nr:3D-(3,5/4)-trihydroxycyclohexane-1,2-dione acylhydrolase (decyclizing) [Enterovibrio norvegicus]OEE55642.1 3D-(3,5/4)-trihydroxycyclohexane-1,2-dione acylhydrolase (decyclizing) [Enterovibrio norvegicus]OEF58431.1 3D-(3,5/4)-trihydroxycyclohexane-1,2-dione acylhydrolase (decyclizing) [Enterovibrio norvegicus]
MTTIRLTTAQALVRYLAAQQIEIDGKVESLFGCAFAIFGHGNVTCLGQQLFENQSVFPTWRGQNEQSMALAAVAYARANQRRRIGIATSSVGPGATNMITAAGVAHTNRLPLLLLAGDTFQSRLPDPVLQQTEHFSNPSLTVNDAFKTVTRFWDRINAPSQLTVALPQAIATMLDPADCGPAMIALPQDVQGQAWDFPESFFAPKVHRIRRPQPEPIELDLAAEAIKKAKRPLIIAGGGVAYSGARNALIQFAEKHQIPVVETIAGRTLLSADHPLNCGPIGTTGSNSANHMCEDADVVIAIGTRLQDFTTGSWTVFRDPDMKLISINAGRFDATKHMAQSIISDAKAAIAPLSERLGNWQTQNAWVDKAAAETSQWRGVVEQRTAASDTALPSYAQIIGKVNSLVNEGDRVITAAGGLPAELNMNWQATYPYSLDVEFGFSCMGYEIAAGWGNKIARPDHESIVLVGDGSYLMMNSDIYSSVLTGHKMIVLVCDNGGFAVIRKLQTNTGNTAFNNQLEDCTTERDYELPRVDFVSHARGLGANAEKVEHLSDFEAAFERAKASDKTYVIVTDIDDTVWSSCDAWWEVGLSEVTDNESIANARDQWEEGRKHQRRGV